MKLTPEQISRNEVIEEMAKLLETCAGEFLNDGQAFHQCARLMRERKTCPDCGQVACQKWELKEHKWVPHSCATKA